MPNTYRLKELCFKDLTANSVTIEATEDSGKEHDISFEVNGENKIHASGCPQICITEAEDFMNSLGDLQSYDTSQFVYKTETQTQTESNTRYIF